MIATFLDRGTFPKHFKLIPPLGVDEWIEYDHSSQNEVLERCQNAHIILTNKVIIDRHTIKKLHKLKLICVTATGINNVDIEACRDNNVSVINATDYGTESVTEHVLMLMLALSRNLPAYMDANLNKSWSKSSFFCDRMATINQLSGKTLTIIGKGTIGKSVGRLANAFGMSVLYAERKNLSDIRPGYTEFFSAISQADYISLHCALTEQTHHLINKSTLAKMKPNAILINTGRGPLINDIDLLKALKHKVISAAGLDVSESEPPKTDDVIWQLNSLPNVILTPHIAWGADEAMKNLLTQITHKIEAFINGTLQDNLAK